MLRMSDRLYAGGASEYGVLPGLLIVATVVTGVVDSVSYLGLHHVFVANMTGNVVFLGFALAGAKGTPVWAPCLAVGSFLVGAWTENRIAPRSEGFRELRLLRAVMVHGLFVAAALTVAASAGIATTGAKAALTALLAFGLGVQNAVVRRLAVPDLTTTVLTLTVTGIASDPPGRATVRRLISVACILAGALAGAWLLLHHGATSALSLDLILTASVALLTWLGAAPSRPDIEESRTTSSAPSTT